MNLKMKATQIIRTLFLAFSFLMLLVGKSYCQTDEQLGLHSEGGPWKFYPVPLVNDSLAKVLLIGDSVMNGYHQFVSDSLNRKANVDYWLTPFHLKSEYLFTDLAKVVAFHDYDLIHFNIGLHGWPEGRIPDDEYVPLMEKYVQVIRDNTSNAKLIWASITPVTEIGKAELNKEVNPVIVKRNKLINEIMLKNKVPINDLYQLSIENLHLSKGDRFHWKPEGYEIMASQCVSYILKELE